MGMFNVTTNEAPLYAVRGDRSGDATFAVYSSGLARRIGTTETAFLQKRGMAIVVETQRDVYLELIAWSGTDWRPTA